MPDMSRRDFLIVSSALALLSAGPSAAAQRKSAPLYPATIRILKEAFHIEMAAHAHYAGYTGRAMEENYPNMAYLFHTFSLSEKIHADNYRKIVLSLGSAIKKTEMRLFIEDTKSNLQNAARKELEKIEIVYPDLLRQLEPENYDEAIIHCMYSWKSHRQHEATIQKIDRYSGWFFGSVAREIEEMHMDFFVCSICGSTIDEKPLSPCIICNRSATRYRRVERPFPS